MRRVPTAMPLRAAMSPMLRPDSSSRRSLRFFSTARVAFHRVGYHATVTEQGYFGADSVLHRVHREQVVALAGPRALLMQAAHPVAFAGFFASTGALDDPYPRLERTAAA